MFFALFAVATCVLSNVMHMAIDGDEPWNQSSPPHSGWRR